MVEQGADGADALVTHTRTHEAYTHLDQLYTHVTFSEQVIWEYDDLTSANRMSSER